MNWLKNKTSLLLCIFLVTLTLLPNCIGSSDTKTSATQQDIKKCQRLAQVFQAAWQRDGIIVDDIEKTIKNIGMIGSDGMAETDKMILDMMKKK